MKLPKELKHLERFSEYARHIKGDVYGFYIPQFVEGTSATNPVWLDFRSETIGASESAIILPQKLDEWKSKAEYFREKIGEAVAKKPNSFMITGHDMEPIIETNWKHYDGTEDGWIDRRLKGKPFRTGQNINAFAVNIKYPYMSASLDYVCHKDQVSPLTGEEVPYTFPVEFKTISFREADKYEHGMPIRYVCQLHHQMVVWGSDYCEFAMMIDRNFDVLPFNRSEDFSKTVIDSCKQFYEEKMVPAKKIVAKKQAVLADIENARADADMELLEKLHKKHDDLEAKLQALEPDPDDSKAWENWYTDKYKQRLEEKEDVGSDEALEDCIEYDKVHKQEKEVKKKKQEYKNKIIKHHTESGAVNLTYGDAGKSIYRPGGDGKRSYFKVSVDY